MAVAKMNIFPINNDKIDLKYRKNDRINNIEANIEFY